MRRRSRSACSGPHLDEVTQLRARAVAQRRVVREADGLDIELREARDRAAGPEQALGGHPMAVMSRSERPMRSRYRRTMRPEPRWPASISVISSSTMRCAFEPIARTAWMPGTISTFAPSSLGLMLRAERPPEQVRDGEDE